MFIYFFSIFAFFYIENFNLVNTKLEKNFDVQVIANHQNDSISLLVYVLLLVLVILTIWLFKHKKLKFFHETGLAVIYGLITGALIAYTIKKEEDSISESNESTSKTINLTNLNVSNVINNITYSPEIIKLDDLQDKATFNPEIFFNVILPPIIFNAGYQMKKKHFFENIGSILTFAFLGTTISAISIGGLLFGLSKLIRSSKIFLFSDCFFFGAIISATDPVTVLAIFKDLNVDPTLHSLVFGESILNDAVAIVLAHVIESYESDFSGLDLVAILKSFGYFLKVFFGSLSIGCSMGCITAFLTKFTQIKTYPLLESSLFVLMSYATFLSAECLQLTGIVSVLFCGICQAHYTYNNLSSTSQNSTIELFNLLNFLMENFLFVYIGVSTFTFRKHSWDAPLIFFGLISVIIGRACNIYPLSFFLNFGKKEKISFNMQNVMMFSGLRGAMAFALAIQNTSTVAKQTILTITLVVVMVTVVLFGGFTPKILYFFKIRVGVDYNRLLEEPLPTDSDVELIDVLSRRSHIIRFWRRIDINLLKPLLTHYKPPLTFTLPPSLHWISYHLSSREQLEEPMSEDPSTLSYPYNQRYPINDHVIMKPEDEEEIPTEILNSNFKKSDSLTFNNLDN